MEERIVEFKQGTRESTVEAKLRDKVKDRGGLALKFVSPGYTGVPDRLLLAPGGKLIFAEVKAPGKKPTALQEHRHNQLRALGFKVNVVDSYATINSTLEELFDEQ